VKIERKLLNYKRENLKESKSLNKILSKKKKSLNKIGPKLHDFNTSMAKCSCSRCFEHEFINKYKFHPTS
jgi:hypothetical protein